MSPGARSTEHQPSGPGGSARPTPRDRSIDVAKGIAIILIVAGHVWRGLGAAGVATVSPRTYQEVDTALYAVHLPVFAFLAGLFVQRSIERRGARGYLTRRALDFVWLFLLWTTLQSVVRLLVANRTNHPLAPADFLRTYWVKDSQMWFLPFLLLATLLVVWVRPWRSARLAWGSSAVVGVVAVATWGRDLPWVGLAGLPLLIFFWAGSLLRADGLLRVWAHRAWPAVAIVGGLAALIALAVTDPATATWSAAPLTLPVVALGIVASVGATAAALGGARALAVLPGSRVLASLGQRSLEIFLAHILAAAGCRIALLGLGITTWPAHLVVGTLAGLVFPLLLWRISRAGPLRFLFTAPTLTAAT